MTLVPKGVEAVEDFNPTSDTYLEIDDLEYISEGEEKKSFKDPFAKVRWADFTGNTKRRAGRLAKRMQSTDGDTKSKYIDDEFISGYALFDLALPPYDLNALAKIYEENAIHNAAVNAKAMNCVGLGYTWEQTRKTKKKLEKAGEDTDKYERVMNAVHEEMEKLDDIFEDFHEEETFTETLTKAAMDMYALGNGYIEVGRKLDGTIGYIGHIPAHQIRVRKDRDGFVQQVFSNKKPQAVFFRNYADKETADPINQDPRPNELIHLKLYSPASSYYGVPNVVSALSSIVGDKFAKEYNIDYFENKAIPRYAVIIKGAKLSEKAKRELVQYFRNEVKGKSHGTLVIPLPATMGANVDVKFEKLEAGMQDASFERYRKSNRDEIVSAHRVPPTKVGIYDNANLAVSRDADKTFKEQVIGPDQERIEKRVNRLVAEFTDALQFRFVKLDIVDADMKSRIHDRYLRTEVIEPNEVRNELGLPAREGGSEILPFPTKVQVEKMKLDVQEREKDRKAQVKLRSTGTPGAPSGNTNNPAKSGENTPKDQIGTRAERGEAQDNEGVRDRS